MALMGDLPAVCTHRPSPVREDRIRVRTSQTPSECLQYIMKGVNRTAFRKDKVNRVRGAWERKENIAVKEKHPALMNHIADGQAARTAFVPGEASAFPVPARLRPVQTAPKGWNEKQI